MAALSVPALAADTDQNLKQEIEKVISAYAASSQFAPVNRSN
jgi:hypothetical protein